MTYARLRAMGNNGFQEPATGIEGRPAGGGTITAAPGGAVGGGTATQAACGKEVVQQGGTNPAGPAGSDTARIVGTKRLYTDGKFNKPDGRAVFAVTQWRGLQAAGKQAEKDTFAFLINNGRANHVWQSAYLDQFNDFPMDRFPLPYIQINLVDMVELKLNPGDLVEVYNDNGSTEAMAWPTDTARPRETFTLFGYPTGAAGNVVSKAANELIIPNYKQSWGNVRKIADAPDVTKRPFGK